MIEPELLLSHHDFVRALAAELLRDPASIDDVSQQTMLAAWERRDEPPPRSLRAWLAGVTRNFSRQLHRGDERRRDREQLAAARELVPSVATVVEREERRRAVVAAVLALAEPYRDAVLLRFYESLAPREIARRLDVPVETARTRVKRGVEQLRARLVDQDGARRPLRAWLLPIAGPVARGLSPAAKLATLAAASLLIGIAGWIGVAAPWSAGRRDPGIVASAAAATNDADPSRDVDPHGAPLLAATRESPAPAPAEPDSPAPATRTIRGRVVDSRDAPIPDATVFAWPERLEEAIRLADAAAISRRPHAATDREGRFELAVPASLVRCTLLALAEGRSPGTRISVLPGDEPTLVLEECDVLVGVVTDDRGEPIADARVRCWGMHGGALIEHATTSSSDGRYRLVAPIADRAAWQGDGESWAWWVGVTAGGFAPRVLPQSRNLDPDAQPGEHRLDVTMHRGATCFGRVVDAESHEPIPGARVVLVAFEDWTGMSRDVGGSLMNPYGERALDEVTSDESGLFQFDHVPVLPTCDPKPAPPARPVNDRRLQAYASASGHAAAFHDVTLETERDSTEITIEMWQAATICGRVVDSAGAPVAGLRVTASLSDPVSRKWLRARTVSRDCVHDGLNSVVRSGVDGRYSLGGIPIGADGNVVQLAVDYDEQWQDVEPIAVEVHPGEIAAAPDLIVKPQPSIVIEVVDEAGQPVADAVVHAGERRMLRRTDEHGRVRWSQPLSYLTDRSGSGKWTDTARFRIEKPGFARLLTDECRIAESDPPPSLRVVMARGHTLLGRVSDPTGRPLARAGVLLLPADVPEEELARLRRGEWVSSADVLLADVATGSDGTFEIADLPARPMKLVARAPLGLRGGDEFSQLELDVEPGKDLGPLLLRLERR